MVRKWIYAALSSAVLGACGPSTGGEGQAKGHDLLALGDSLALQAQQALMSQVAAAIGARGPAGAVGFCNERALPLTDSLAMHHRVGLKRLSDRARNPLNEVANEQDKSAWLSLQRMMSDTGVVKKHLLVREGDAAVYYKAISLGMPMCLNCHGQREGEVAAETWAAIAARYPNDRATGYKLGELRGMWRIEFPPAP